GAARAATSTTGLVYYEPPIHLPRVALDIGWHERMRRHPVHRWFRDLVQDVAQQVAQSHALPARSS
ncbi:MAG: hypothetical protein AAGC55_34435, partial [Myxococcota bacterium]